MLTFATKKLSTGQMDRFPMETFATKTLSTGANGQNEDAASFVLIELSLRDGPDLAASEFGVERKV